MYQTQLSMYQTQLSMSLCIKHSYPCLCVSSTAIHVFVYQPQLSMSLYQTQVSMYQTQLSICTSVPLYTDKYTCIYIYIRLLLPSSWLLLVPSICRSIPLYTDEYIIADYDGLLLCLCLYKGWRLCRRPLCLGPKHDKHVYYRQTCPKICVFSFGAQLLGPQPWFPVLGRLGPWPIGPSCVASRLACYVLHQCLETMCCIGLGRRWSCMTHHDDDHYHYDHDHHRCSCQACAKKSEGLGRVGFYFSKFGAPLDYFTSSALLAIIESCSPGMAGWLADWLARMLTVIVEETLALLEAYTFSKENKLRSPRSHRQPPHFYRTSCPQSVSPA
jgi:hypothetical protein